MQVTWAGVIKGRGPVAAVTDAPRSGLVEGVLVLQDVHVDRLALLLGEAGDGL